MATPPRGVPRRGDADTEVGEIGVKALRTHLGQLLGIAQVSDTQEQYERNVNKVFGTQLVLPMPSPR